MFQIGPCGVNPPDRVGRQSGGGKSRRRTRNHSASASVREQQLRESLRQAETRLREVHHRIKNSLQVVASLLVMQTDAANDRVVRKVLSDAAMRISTIALIHAQLCEAPAGASVDMRAFVQELVANIRRTIADPRSGVDTTLDIAPLTFPLDLATHCGLLISELVTNAFQHAFPAADEGTIEVRLSVHEGEGTLSVRDNGVGMTRNADRNARGIGVHLVQLLATRQLRGRLWVSGRKGTRVRVKFPLAGGSDE